MPEAIEFREVSVIQGVVIGVRDRSHAAPLRKIAGVVSVRYHEGVTENFVVLTIKENKIEKVEKKIKRKGYEIQN